MNERVVTFGEENRLVGIITSPDLEHEDRKKSVVLLLNAGRVHRVGPHRIYVQLARMLAERGHPVLRFDFSGIGDSPVSTSNASFEDRVANEAKTACEFATKTLHRDDIVVVGLCSGADAGFELARKNSQVTGAILINGGIPADGAHEGLYAIAQSRTKQRYYRSRLGDRRSWGRLIRADTDISSLIRVVGSWARSRFPSKRATEFSSMGVSIALDEIALRNIKLTYVFSEGSTGRDVLDIRFGIAGRDLADFGNVELHLVQGCDHTFTPVWSQRELIAIVQSSAAIAGDARNETR